MPENDCFVHPSAVVSKGADLDKGVEIGPYCLIGDKVRIGRNTRVLGHAVLEGPLEIGQECCIHSFCTIGMTPQDLKFGGEETSVRIGDRNVLREYVNISRGTAGGGGVTSLGNDNNIMAYSHIAHDCVVADGTIFANAATLAGHVQVDSHATIGAFSGIHQFCRVGRHAFIGGYSVITMDALPFMMTVGNRARAYGINIVGLKRRGFSRERIAILRQAARILFQSKMNTSGALEEMEKAFAEPNEDLKCLEEFIRTTKRGIIKR